MANTDNEGLVRLCRGPTHYLSRVRSLPLRRQGVSSMGNGRRLSQSSSANCSRGKLKPNFNISSFQIRQVATRGQLLKLSRHSRRRIDLQTDNEYAPSEALDDMTGSTKFGADLNSISSKPRAPAIIVLISQCSGRVRVSPSAL
jgi:hypothetical protein